MLRSIAHRFGVVTFAVAGALLVVTSGWTSYRRLVELQDANRSVTHSHDVKTELNGMLALVTEAETGQRGFIITDAGSYLDAYRTAVTLIPARLERARRLTADNAVQQNNLAALETLIREKLAELNARIDVRRTLGFDAAARIMQTDEGKRIMDRIRGLIGTMREEESRVLESRIQREEHAARAAAATTIGGLALALGFLCAASLMLQRATQARERAQAVAVEAQAGERMKDEFLAVLSHELRTPMTTTLGWVRMLQTAQLDETRQARALEAIERSTRAEAHMIDQMLDLARIAAGKMTLDRREMSLAPLIVECVESLEPDASAKGLTLDTHIGPRAEGSPAGMVSADASRMRQVVLNLLVNAIKFTPSGGHVDVHVTVADGAVQLLVQDTGVGIDKELLAYVFERFRQAERRRAGAQGGLGLGLAIVKQIVELHDGTVEARSDGPGRGATFIVSLPTSRSSPASPR